MPGSLVWSCTYKTRRIWREVFWIGTSIVLPADIYLIRSILSGVTVHRELCIQNNHPSSFFWRIHPPKKNNTSETRNTVSNVLFSVNLELAIIYYIYIYIEPLSAVGNTGTDILAKDKTIHTHWSAMFLLDVHLGARCPRTIVRIRNTLPRFIIHLKF